MAENFYDDEIEQAKAEQKKLFDQKRKRLLSDVRKLLSMPEGRRVIWHLWSVCGTFNASYSPKDTNHTMFREGQRDVGLAILQLVAEAKPEAYAQMQREFNSEQKSIKQEKSDE